MALNWPGLLAWSTSYHDGTAPSAFKEMSPEDKAFLMKAMEEALGQMEDLNKPMKEAIRKIGDPSTSLEELITALNLMDRVADEPDCPRNLEVLGGTVPLLYACRHSHLQVRQAALQIFSLIVQNNPKVQEAALKHGGLVQLLAQLAEPTRGLRSTTRIAQDAAEAAAAAGAAAAAAVAAAGDAAWTGAADSSETALELSQQDRDLLHKTTLSALGAMIRHLPAAEEGFLAGGGLALLDSLLRQGPPQQMQTKIEALKAHFAARLEEAREAAAEQAAASAVASAGGTAGGQDGGAEASPTLALGQ